MALEFTLHGREKTVPVVIDGEEYAAKAGSAKAVAALTELAEGMAALGGVAEGDMGPEAVSAALKSVDALDATLRRAVGALFGEGAVAGIVGADKADIGTCVGVTRLLTAVINSDEYMAATVERVSEMARVAGED